MSGSLSGLVRESTKRQLVETRSLADVLTVQTAMLLRGDIVALGETELLIIEGCRRRSRVAVAKGNELVSGATTSLSHSRRRSL